MSQRAFDPLQNGIRPTIDALLRTGYGDPSFSDGVVALDRDAQEYYSGLTGGAGGSGHVYDWLARRCALRLG